MYIQKPEVRIVEPQQEQTVSTDIVGYEADALLAKYGFKSQPTQPVQQEPINPDANLTFEELVARQERERQNEIQRKQQQMNGPRPYSFDPNRVGYSDNKYASIEGENFGISIQIVSDMPRW
jgi:hypothetical protein